MPRGDIETYLEDGQWHNRVEGEGEVLSHTTTRRRPLQQVVERPMSARSSTSSRRKPDPSVRQVSRSLGESRDLEDPERSGSGSASRL